jgi:6-phosphogluconate dehydrogenase
MTNKQPQQQYAIGMVGLGVMGRNLLLNMADHGFPVAAGDPNPLVAKTRSV